MTLVWVSDVHLCDSGVKVFTRSVLYTSRRCSLDLSINMYQSHMVTLRQADVSEPDRGNSPTTPHLFKRAPIL